MTMDIRIGMCPMTVKGFVWGPHESLEGVLFAVQPLVAPYVARVCKNCGSLYAVRQEAQQDG